MTVRELDNSFKLYLDKVDSMAVLDFLVEERQRFLNDALLWVARKLTSSKDNNQDKVDARRMLSTPLDLPLGPGAHNSAASILPDNYLHFGRLVIQLKAPLANYQVAPKIAAESELSKLLDDPFNSPTIGEPLICFLNNQVLAFPKASCDRLTGSYYRRPTLIDLSFPTSLVDMTEEQIPVVVQQAVQLAVESIADPRFQTQAQIANVTKNPN